MIYLQKELEFERVQWLDLQKQIKEIKKCKSAQNLANEKIMSIHQQVEDMSTKIST